MIKICHGSEQGNPTCAECKHLMDNQPDFQGLRYEPAGKYQFLDEWICKLDKPHYSQFMIIEAAIQA